MKTSVWMVVEKRPESEFNSNREEQCLGELVQVLVQIARHLCLINLREKDIMTRENKTKQVVT